MKPTSGRIVHFHHQGAVWPAIVTSVNHDHIDLVVFGFRKRAAQIFENVRMDESSEPADLTWSWPPITRQQ